MKKILSAFIICFLIFWAGRIISINQNPPIIAYYDIGDTLDCGDLEVSFHKDISFPESIGILIENPSFLPQYTGFKNLKLLAGLTGGISDEDIRTALEHVGLDPDDKRTYRKYSLGMKQKLGIANAIMGEPDVIILDEPINALDEESVRKIKRVLLEIRNKDKLIIIACHDREELEYLSDIIYEIKDGSIVDRKEITNDNT